MANDVIYKPGDNLRSECGNARLSFHSEWSPSLPWASYIRGSAGRHYRSLLEAVADMRRRGYIFNNLEPR